MYALTGFTHSVEPTPGVPQCHTPDIRETGLCSSQQSPRDQIGW